MTPIQDKEYRYITDFIYDYCKIALGDNKKELVTARLGKRLRHFNFTTFQQYIDFIQSPQGSVRFAALLHCQRVANHSGEGNHSTRISLLRSTYVLTGSPPRRPRQEAALNSPPPSTAQH